MSSGSLCGVWIDDQGKARLSVESGDEAGASAGGRVGGRGGRRTETTADFRPFAWLAEPAGDPASFAGITVEALAGDGPFRRLAQADSPAAFDALTAGIRPHSEIDYVRPLESQFLLQTRTRLFADLPFARLRRCQFDIETGSADGSFSDADRAGDRVLAIGLRTDGRTDLLILDEMSDAGERRLLEAFALALAAADPDVIEGHNLFRFDLDYLRRRCRRYRLPCAWGRFGQPATFRRSRLKVAERLIDFPRCDLPGRAVVDTCFLAQFYDLAARELPSYGLKDVAIHLGVTGEGGAGRTYIPGAEIAGVFSSDPVRFKAYLADDLRETAGIADVLLPTYFEQTRSFPITLQEATLRGTAGKVDLLFLEEYHHARRALPRPPPVAPFGGGYTRSFREGVFRHVLHFDVASLYPSLLLSIGRNPVGDTLGVFIPLLTRLREYRLRYKLLARSAPTEEERAEAGARQASFKILINSFYGYLGFSGARFADGDLAAEVTRRGRDLMQALIDAFTALGCTILEADTDGIYLQSDRHYAEPDSLLAAVAHVLPTGIELEFDGRYPAMFCYKAKNYALNDGRRVVIRGSALRSRGMEPFLKRLTDALIGSLVGEASSPSAGARAAEPRSLAVLLADYSRRIADRTMPVAELARSETLGQSPEAYERFVEAGGKPRRASSEAALRLSPRPRMGDKVAYYITPSAGKGQGSDWQRARPTQHFDPAASPYDPAYYLEKLQDWITRYRPFLDPEAAAAADLAPPPSATPEQGELF